PTPPSPDRPADESGSSVAFRQRATQARDRSEPVARSDGLRYGAMGCLIAVLALVTPRFVMVVLWAFTDYLSRAFGHWFWPALGFVFLPTTTLGYAVAQNRFGGVRGWGLFFVIVGVALD